MKQSLLFPLVMACGITSLSAQNCVTLLIPDGKTTSVKPIISYSGDHNTAKSYDLYIDKNQNPTTLAGSNPENKSRFYPSLSSTGTYYYKIVAKDASGNELCTSETQTINAVSAPVNDKPENATPLTIGAAPIQGTTRGVITEFTPSGYKFIRSVYYSFIADKTDILITATDNNSSRDFAKFTIQNSEPDGSIDLGTPYFSTLYSSTYSNVPSLTIGGLTAGEKYYIQVFEPETPKESDIDFSISVKNVQVPPSCLKGHFRYDARNQPFIAIDNLIESTASSVELYLSKHTTNLVQPSNLVDTKVVKGNNSVFILPQPLGNGIYYWTLVAKNSAGSTRQCDSNFPYFSITGSSENAAFSAQLYPNPATDVISISMANITENLTFTILDTRGNIVKTKTFIKPLNINGAIETMNVSDLLPGTYYLNIKGTNTNYSSTFIKK